MDRRSYLTLTAGLAASVAGCSGLDEGGDDGETISDGSEDPADDTTEQVTIPGWARWLPASFISDGTEILTFDTDRGKEEFPEDFYAETRIPDIADRLGVAEADIDRMSGIQHGDGSNDVVLTGRFDVDEAIEALEVPKADVGSYRGYTAAGDETVIGDSVVIISPDYESFIDAHEDETHLGADDDDWTELLAAVNAGTLALAGPGTPGDSDGDDIDPSKFGMAMSGSGEDVSFDAYFYFESESEAAEGLENAEDTLRSDAGDDAEIESLEQDGRRVIVSGTLPDFEF